MTGNDLRQWRKNHGLKQKELARLLGVRNLAISRWERGERGIPALLPLALEALENKLKVIEMLMERDPEEAEGLKNLMYAEVCFERALLTGAEDLYREAMGLADRVLQIFPWSAVAHYISGMGHLKVQGNKDYAKEKYEALVALGDASGLKLAEHLKNGMEKL